MSRPPFTPSEADRVSVCLGSAVLPRVSHRSAGAALGTVNHRFYQRCIEAGREAALAEVQDPALREMLEVLNLDGLELSAFASEVAFAWDWTTDAARELGRGTDRSYEDLKPTEIPGTIDYGALVGSDAVLVGDFKSEFLFVPPAKDFEQLQLGAIMATRAWGRDRALVEVTRPRKDEPPWRDRGELGLWDLAAAAEKFRARAERVLEARAAYAAGVEPKLVTSASCRYCKSFEFCPAQTTLLRRLSGDDGELEEKFFAALSPETAARAWHRLQAAKQLLERLEGALETYALHNPIDLGDGRVYGMKAQQSLSFNGSAVWAFIAERLGANEAWSHVDIKVVQKKVKERLGKLVTAAGKDAQLEAQLWQIVRDGGRKAKRLSATAVFDGLVGLLEQTGGAKRSTVEFVKVHKKGKDDADDEAA